MYSVTDNPAFSAAINSNLNRIWTAEEILNSGLVLTLILLPVFPGKLFSNTNYIIIAYIINKIMHTDISEQLHSRFFNPLNMNESFFEFRTLLHCHMLITGSISMVTESLMMHLLFLQLQFTVQLSAQEELLQDPKIL
ncbi:MAG: hypothetical protein IPL16_12960 [Ignavibacteria bacterium]|nr:hypothetical protein [Ignavibacteria bacterium]